MLPAFKLTACTIDFDTEGHTEAALFHPVAGQPKIMGVVLHRFFSELESVGDPFSDKSGLLAAKFVAWLATGPFHGQLGVQSVRIIRDSDQRDVPYQYTVDCSSAAFTRPVVSCHASGIPAVVPNF